MEDNYLIKQLLELLSGLIPGSLSTWLLVGGGLFFLVTKPETQAKLWAKVKAIFGFKPKTETVQATGLSTPSTTRLEQLILATDDFIRADNQEGVQDMLSAIGKLRAEKPKLIAKTIMVPVEMVPSSDSLPTT
jgi:hypothetical protein